MRPSRALLFLFGTVACAASAAIEALNHMLVMKWATTNMHYYHVISALFHALVLLVPMLLYAEWRQTAKRETETLDKLRVSEALRVDMTNMLVHDLKSPLSASILSLQLVLEREGESGNLEEDELELVTIAFQSQERLVAMIADILDVARAEAGEMSLMRQPSDIAQIVEAALKEAEPTGRKKELHLIGQYGAHPTLNVDREKLRRVMDNLLANAIRYTPRGGSVTVGVDVTGVEARVAVKDTGSGIPEHLYCLIFDKFRQADAAKEVGKLSVGLGLAFCKLVVEAHSGRIWVESEVGKGSSFFFALPLDNG